MPGLTRRTALLALAPALLPRRAAAGPGDRVIPGIFALADGAAKVSATLVVMPGEAGAKLLDIAMTRPGAPRPVARYDVELGKRLHVIAISDDFTTFLHEHGDEPGADGHFRVPMTFPRGGAWHVYADAVPTGLGQQVMRFDVNLDRAAPAGASAPPRPTGLSGSDGRYAVQFDALELRAGQQARLGLRVLRDGQAAPDLTPYLGVAAHAVFIATADLTYVHAHAAEAPMAKAMAHMGHDAMPTAPLRAGAKVSPAMVLHLRAPRAGTYALWVQFMAGGEVRTVPLVVAVA